MGPVREQIQWNVTSRVLLINTVINVEEEIRNNLNVKVKGKWHRINNLLPPHLRGRTWNCQKQAYNHYKCSRVFSTLVKIYRGMKRRMPKDPRGQIILNKPVFDAMKKREDMLNSQISTSAKNCLKSGSPPRGNSTGSTSHQKLLSSSINVGAYRKAQIQWNETAHIVLIEAVILVEEEIRNNTNSKKIRGKWERINNLLPPYLRGRSSGSIRDYKCRRTFQDLVKVYRGNNQRGYKRFPGRILTKPILEILKKREDLLNTWRSTQAENSLNSGSPARVSNSIGLEGGRQKNMSTSINSLTNTHCNRGQSPERQTIGTETESKEGGENFAFFPHTTSASKQHLPWTTELHESLVDAVTKLGGACRALPEDVRRVMGVEGLTIYQVRSHLQMYRLRYIAKSPWPEGKKLDKESSEDVIATTHAPSTNHEGSSLGYASKSLGESEGPEIQNKSTCSPLGRISKSVSESFHNPEKMISQTSAPARVQSGFETSAPGSRVDCRQSTMTPSDHSLTLKSNSKVYTKYDEHLHSILDEPLRRLDLEFSSLSSWVESKLIPDGKKVMYGMTCSTNQSTKRRKLNSGTDPLDEIFHQSRSSWIDFQIRALFQRLKVRLVKELKNTSMEVVQLVR